MPAELDRDRLLRRVAKARGRWEQAEQAARRIALEAVDAGVPATHVAEAAGVTRMTLWRWAQR